MLALIVLTLILAIAAKSPDTFRQFAQFRYYKVGDYVVDVYSVGCYVGIGVLLYYLWCSINKDGFKGDCYGQPTQYRGDLPGRYSNVPKGTVENKYFNRLSKEDRETDDKKRF
tara:strand:- start:569 stop:907 length:339 start_codon:yes stop_codon:yes gene_type:complete